MKNLGLYDKSFEHDSCGVGFVVNINGSKTHKIVTDGIEILKNLEHRGALGGDMQTGDGAGILLQIPHEFFKNIIQTKKDQLPEPEHYGVGFLFMPNKQSERQKIQNKIKTIVNAEGGKILAWRDVPTDSKSLGSIAKSSMPFIKQFFVVYKDLSNDILERKLYVLRKIIENKISEMGVSMEDFYIPSLSCKTIVYKGMFVAQQLKNFYTDLSDKNFTSALALVHQRYSTNTFPSWPLAQPFRYIAHNGEINTIKGNVKYMSAREKTLASKYFPNNIGKLFPIVMPNGSDSGMFDNTYELLANSGRSLEHAMMMMVPEAFGPKYHISQDKRAFYEYHSAFMEPWDGPAAIAFTDGVKIGAVLDRNGLRPARYVITKSGQVILASEVGVLDVKPENVLEKGRLAPGKMILVDTSIGRVKNDNEIKSSVARSKMYRRWLEKYKIELNGLLQSAGPVSVEQESIKIRHKLFGYTVEDMNKVIAPMAANAQEPIGSMGDDESPAVLAHRPQLLYRYFKQLFAQVTNPPIDPYRENLVMSLMSFIGRERNLLEESPKHCSQLKLAHPILTNEDIEKLLNHKSNELKTSIVSMLFNARHIKTGLEKGLQNLCRNVEKQIDLGSSIVIISDKKADKNNAPIPALLAVSTINNYLIKKGKRHLVGIIVQTGEAKEVMHFATLIGFGASAVNPYLAFETLAFLKDNNYLSKDITLEVAIDNYITAIKKGLLKVMSKMGVSTIRSYKGAQIFEAVGLNTDFINKYFPDVPSRIEGIGLNEICRETLNRHQRAFEESKTVHSGGHMHYRKFSENHLLSPEAVVNIQRAVREKNYSLYKKYALEINNQEKSLCTFRGLFKFKRSKSISIDKVEPVESIVKRFVSSAMSFGSISPEAHETMAIAMNRLGGQSNSGEGGEDERRYKILKNGDSLKSKVKQIASGRFGVTSHYLVNAEELQIKMAQGAKPGEGGQLPGHKVNDVIAKVRYSTPGVMLISPPPHHDIYSIEDLAQLIYDLKNANREARVSVKLVSEVGVGTVAAGVAKGKADMVLISGGDGGTGASPISSVKYAGMPWEIGLSEVQQTLVLNNLRDRIRIQTDGQLRTGRDVAIAALLGAEEFGFGTISLVTLGCVMMRKCHLNTCPVGVATQDPELRKKFKGKPEHLMNYMNFVAQELREIMAQLGFKKVDEMIGQVDKIKVNDAIDHWKVKGLDFSKVLEKAPLQKGGAYYCRHAQQQDFTKSIDEKLIKMSKAALEKKQKVSISQKIRNSNRTIGTQLSAEVSKKYGSKGLKPDTINCKFTGVAGQSFGAFLASGITFELEGDANDYLGKGLSGGKIILYPKKGSSYRAQRNIITGNVNLFGATSGEVYIHGMAGERFAVRNSGVTAVVEGVGDHGCEYMTGGIVVVLGKTGVNFAAGMSGGIAYVFDDNQLFDTKCNLEMVDLEPVTEEEDIKFLYGIIKKHISYTESEYAAYILKHWDEMLPKFVKVFPIDYKKALERIKREQFKDTEIVTLTEEV